MRPFLSALILGVAALLFVSPSHAQSPGSVLTNDDVVELAKAGLSDDVIVTSIQQAGQRRFDLETQGLLALKKAGVSDRVIAAMQRSSVPAPPTASAAPATRAGGLDRRMAENALNSTSYFAEPLSVLLPPTRQCSRELTPSEKFQRAYVQDLDPAFNQDAPLVAVAENLGLIETATTPAKPGECPAGTANVIAMRLTPAGEAVAVQTPGGSTAIPLYRRVLTITGVRGGASDAEVQFTWRWTRADGRELVQQIARPGIAPFSLFDDGWRPDNSRLRLAFFDFRGVRYPPPMEMSATAPSSSASAAPPSGGSTVPAATVAATGSARVADARLTPLVQQLREGRGDVAIAEARALLNGNMNDPALNAFLATALSQQGNYAEATPFLKKAVSMREPVGLTVKHLHTGFDQDGFCTGVLEVTPNSVVFTSSTLADHVFRGSIGQGFSVRARSGFAEIRPAADRTRQEGTFDAYLTQTVLRQRLIVRSPSCESCELQVAALVEMISAAAGK